MSGIYDRGRAAFIKSAETMGLTRVEAKKLADQIMGTPPSKTTYLKGDLQDLQAKLADAKARLAKAPSSKTAKIKGEISDLQHKIDLAKLGLGQLHDKTVYINAHMYVTGSSQAQAAVSTSGSGRIFERAGGGLIRGPGTSTSDSIPLMASDGEYVIQAASVAKYGLAFLNALNDGQLPAGRDTRPGLPATASAAAAASPQQGAGGGEFTGTLVLDSGQFLGVVRGTLQPMIRDSQQQAAFRAKVGRR